MSEPQRLLQEEQGGDELTRSLLRSARDDAPAPHARQKTMIALGLAGGVGATVTAATATSTAATLAKGSASVALLKWIGVGVLGGVVTVGAVAVVQSRNSAAPSVAPSVKTAANPAPIEPAPIQTAAPAAEPAPSAAPIEEPAAKPAEAPKASAKPAEKTSLADEVAALDVARVALASGNAAAALRALDDHDRRFPGGALGPEATVMRIEALALRGDRASAARLGRAFLDAHPRSPHASRIRTLLSLGPQAAPNPGPAGPAQVGATDGSPAP
jgi:hypothetical protein